MPRVGNGRDYGEKALGIKKGLDDVWKDRAGEEGKEDSEGKKDKIEEQGMREGLKKKE